MISKHLNISSTTRQPRMSQRPHWTEWEQFAEDLYTFPKSHPFLSNIDFLYTGAGISPNFDLGDKSFIPLAEYQRAYIMYKQNKAKSQSGDDDAKSTISSVSSVSRLSSVSNASKLSKASKLTQASRPSKITNTTQIAKLAAIQEEPDSPLSQHCKATHKSNRVLPYYPETLSVVPYRPNPPPSSNAQYTSISRIGNPFQLNLNGKQIHFEHETPDGHKFKVQIVN